MNRKLYNILGVALAILLFVGCDEKEEPENDNVEFDVDFLLPECIYAGGTTDVTFIVVGGKAPLMTDSFIFEPVDDISSHANSFLCPIDNVSSGSFTVTVPSSLPAGRYNIYVKRNREKKFYGEIPLYYTPDRPYKVLFIGNSFTVDATYHLPGILMAAGLKNVKLVHMYCGGRTLLTFNSWYSTLDDYTCYTREQGSSVWDESYGMTLHDAVLSDTWDAVAMQESTGSYFAWEWSDVVKDAISDFIYKIKDDQPEKEPKIEYLLSQAFFDLDQIWERNRSHITFSDHEEMFYVCAAQAEKVMAEMDVDGIISTGAALENLRTTSYNNSLGLSRDGYHMDYGISRYAAACTVFETVLSPVFNIYLDDNAYRTTDGVAVTDASQPVALQAARYAIENPFVITDMSEY